MGFKKALKLFVAWLDRKFPDRLEVTVKEWQELNEQIRICKGLPERLLQIESEINKFNASLGFVGGMVSNKLGAFQR